MPAQNQNTGKTPAQIHCETLTRRRKPLIDFSKKPLDEAIKAKDAEIENLTRQLRQLQEANTAKESLIRELEDKLAAAAKPKEPIIIEKTEEVPGTSRRRARQQVEPPKIEEPQKEPEKEQTAPTTTTAPAPGDGISEED